MKTLTAIADDLKHKRVSSRELTDECLANAKKNAEATHAYVALDEAGAHVAAAAADARRAKNESLSDLDGVPIAVKDNILVQGLGATAGSAILKNYRAPYDAGVVTKIKNSGAVIVGKTNLDEFAMGSSTETSCHGATRNPWDNERIPGGSSGGSAVAVAEGSAVASLGSDTGGSIRQPAAMCGVVGLKPTYGRVSRYGLMAMASSLDQIGPFGRSVDDVATLLAAIEGKDERDSTSVHLKPEWKLRERVNGDIKGMRIGLPKEYFVSGMDADVEASVKTAVANLEAAGAIVSEISLPHADYALAAYYIIMPAEVSANLARFDGIRYGARVEGATLEETYRASRRAGFGRETRRRIMLGAYALSAGYYDAYYLKALKVRRLITNDFHEAFTKVDAIVTPTTPTVAWKIGQKFDDPIAMYLSDVYTVSVNVAGLPAASVPCGMSNGLPIGVQVIGKHFDENTVLSVAKSIESAAQFVPFAS